MQTGLTGAIVRICDWIARLAFLNLLWIAFTLVGFVFLGFFPATIAMFSVCRRWVMGEQDVPVYKTFFQSYRTEFRKGNLIGICLMAIVYILWVDYRILQTSANSNLQSLAYLFFLLIVFYGIFLLFLFPMYVHYELKGRQLIKNTLLLAVASPLTAIVMVTGVLFVYYLSLSISGVVFFFSGSILALFIMWFSYRVFQKHKGIELTHEKDVSI
ncbi:YesL family protein [Neobacillus niacini]|uniref:YesL family protein n=1 Tax=Neobacillus niacini TaxID=86668 RepID=UPI003000DBF2